MYLIKRKALPILFVFLFVCTGAWGCSTGSGNIGHSIDTQVNLSEANYTVINSVSGEATARNFIGISLTSSNLHTKAQRRMVESADLEGHSRALINVTTDVERSVGLFLTRRTVYVRADVIEFKD